MTYQDYFNPTLRVIDYDINQVCGKAPESPNAGLMCYLAESFVKSEISKKQEDIFSKKVINLLVSESKEYKEKFFWGWESNPTINNIAFPFDWDDTSKAIDFLRIAAEHNKTGSFDIDKLPNEELLGELFTKSIFTNDYIGEDIKIKCRFNKSLFVFFGENTNDMQKRDDPMVTITTIRMLAKWYPKIVTDNKKIIKILVKRCIFLLNFLLKNQDKEFKQFSRYYFSLGHFSYRLIETIELLKALKVYLKFDFLKIFKLIFCRQSVHQESVKLQVKTAYEKISINCDNNNKQEYYWWYLIGIKLELLSIQPSLEEKINTNCPDRIIFQHRRLNHQYFARNWEKDLLSLELKYFENNIHKNNESNLNGLRNLKKAPAPLFAIVALIIFILSIYLNNESLIKDILNRTTVFKSIATTNPGYGLYLGEEKAKEFFPYINFFLNSIFVIIGIRLYLQAWAIEETFLTIRILSPIKGKYVRRIVSFLDISLRFLWIFMIMLFPIYCSFDYIKELSWHEYLAYIYVLIFIWDIIIGYFYKELYKKLNKNIKYVIANWFGIDFILLLLMAILNIILGTENVWKGWLSVLFNVICIILALFSIYQIYIFSRTIFSNKITYRYDHQ